MKHMPITTILLATLLVFGALAGELIAQSSETSSNRPASAQPQAASPTETPAPQNAETTHAPRVRSAIEILFEEVANLKKELAAVRELLAKRDMEAMQAQRELAELQQFIADHRQYGDDFTQYKAIKAVAEEEARKKELEATRARREAEREERAARRREALAARTAQQAVAGKVAEYRRSGFAPIGLDVYTGKMAFHYATRDGGSSTRIDYDPLIGTYLRPIYSGSELDYTKMTISGSIVNGTDIVRNIGVAITFFDENGNQVGSETVQIANARPDVPYPFTSEVIMALNRAFDSSSTYVLYADEVVATNE